MKTRYIQTVMPSILVFNSIFLHSIPRIRHVWLCRLHMERLLAMSVNPFVNQLQINSAAILKADRGNTKSRSLRINSGHRMRFLPRIISLLPSIAVRFSIDDISTRLISIVRVFCHLWLRDFTFIFIDHFLSGICPSLSVYLFRMALHAFLFVRNCVRLYCLLRRLPITIPHRQI